MLSQWPALIERRMSYSGVADYCTIFDEQMHSLFLLAFLLTADAEKAERCFEGGLGECVEGSDVSTYQPRSWARRAIVRQAIRMVRPAPDQDKREYFISDAPSLPGTNNPFCIIVSLCAFERFVFVMTVLEGQLDEDCQNLLKCSRQDIVMARKEALKLFAAADPGYEHNQETMYIWPRLLN
jgi:hypothetical protein